MLGKTYYHGTLKKYVTLFGTLFNDIYINRSDTVHNVTNSLKVPLIYGPREKVLARLEGDPSLTQPVAMVLPRMAFEITTMTYAPTRKLPTIGKNRKINPDLPDQLNYTYNPVPYDISFSLYIMVKNQEDGTKIVEQILPYFTPEWTTTINLIPELNVVQDIPLVLLNVTPQDTYEGSFEERRVITWTLDFIMKGYFYGPVRKADVITLANTNFFDASDYDNIDDAVGKITPVDWTSIEPGLTANNTPTSNANLSVPRNEITANSQYGFIVRFAPSPGYFSPQVYTIVPATMDDNTTTLLFDTTDVTIDFSSDSDTF